MANCFLGGTCDDDDGFGIGVRVLLAVRDERWYEDVVAGCGLYASLDRLVTLEVQEDELC